MRFSTVFSFALVAAVVAPVLSVPVASPGHKSEVADHYHGGQPDVMDADLHIALRRAIAAYMDESVHSHPARAAHAQNGDKQHGNDGDADDKHPNHGDADDKHPDHGDAGAKHPDHGDADDKHHEQQARALGGLLGRNSPSPSPEPTYFCYMMSANNGKGCDTAQCKSGGGSCVLNSSTNRCSMNNMRGKSAPFACLGCKCSLEKS